MFTVKQILTIVHLVHAKMAVNVRILLVDTNVVVMELDLRESIVRMILTNVLWIELCAAIEDSVSIHEDRLSKFQKLLKATLQKKLKL